LAASRGTGPPLVAETHRLAGRAWHVSLRLALAVDGVDPDGPSIAVERTLPDGSRDTLGAFAPGAGETLLGLCALREGGRIAMPGFAGIERLMARLRHEGQDYLLTEARHSRLGLLKNVVSRSAGTELLQGDVLDLTYQLAPDTLSDVSNWYALVRRVGGDPVPFSSRKPLKESLPRRFVLRAADPNPSSIAMRIPFDLPQESFVRLEVFDLLGRHVANVASRSFPAGEHAASWDLRDDAGVTVRPGVYVCRMVAGSFRAQCKLGVLP